MNVSELIKLFSTKETVPIDIENEVLAAIRDAGVVDELYPWEVDINDGRLRGFLAHWEPWAYQDGTPEGKACADIYVSKHLSPDWVRLVVCKELLHVLDPDALRISKEEEINTLVKKIILPPDLQDPPADGVKVLTDRIAIYEAVAILFPLAVRDLLMPAYLESKVSDADIARLVDLPVRYVAMVMWEGWPDIHETLSTWANGV